jgi:hypothetical protein
MEDRKMEDRKMKTEKSFHRADHPGLIQSAVHPPALSFGLRRHYA